MSFFDSPFSRLWPAPRTLTRRDALLGVAALWTTRGLMAELLETTPTMTEGPFYPDRFPLDTDNDLIVIGDSLTPALGQVLHVTGRVLSASGEPVRNVLVEIWQVDNSGVYIHSGSAGEQQDKMFQGYGRCLTGIDGRYYFRTIRPVRYTGRTPHIHFAVSRGDKRLLTTQMLFEDEQKDNSRDRLFQRVVADKRSLLLTTTTPVVGDPLESLQTEWDIVLGKTPDDETA